MSSSSCADPSPSTKRGVPPAHVVYLGVNHTRGSGCGTPLGTAWWGLQGSQGHEVPSGLVGLQAGF